MATFSISCSFCYVLRSLLFAVILWFRFCIFSFYLKIISFITSTVLEVILGGSWSNEAFILSSKLFHDLSFLPLFVPLFLHFFILSFSPLLFRLWSMFWGNSSLQPYRCVCTSVCNLNNILICIINIATWI